MSLAKLVRPECDTCNTVGPYQATSKLAWSWALANGWRTLAERSRGLRCKLCVPPKEPANMLGRCSVCGYRKRLRVDGMLMSHPSATSNVVGALCPGRGRPPVYSPGPVAETGE